MALRAVSFLLQISVFNLLQLIYTLLISSAFYILYIAFGMFMNVRIDPCVYNNQSPVCRTMFSSYKLFTGYVGQ